MGMAAQTCTQNAMVPSARCAAGMTVYCNELTGGIPCREDAYAALQLYQLYVKDDPALMTYQELVEYELRNMKHTTESKPQGT